MTACVSGDPMTRTAAPCPRGEDHRGALDCAGGAFFCYTCRTLYMVKAEYEGALADRKRLALLELVIGKVVGAHDPRAAAARRRIERLEELYLRGLEELEDEDEEPPE